MQEVGRGKEVLKQANHLRTPLLHDADQIFMFSFVSWSFVDQYLDRYDDVISYTYFAYIWRLVMVKQVNYVMVNDFMNLWQFMFDFMILCLVSWWMMLVPENDLFDVC